MRVISGIAKGKKIPLSISHHLRPTSDKVKEALFNIIADRIEDASFLDLYAGTGSIGIEALSRGAKEVIFIEKETKQFARLRQQLGTYPFSGRWKVFRMPAINYVRQKRRGTFDFIFIDPPYQSDEIGKILPSLMDGAMLTAKGVVFIEHFHKTPLPEPKESLFLSRVYKYGGTLLTLYAKKTEHCGLSRDV